MQNHAPAVDANGSVDRMPLNVFLKLSLEERMSVIQTDPGRILEVYDSWNDYVYMEGYDEDIGQGVLDTPQAQWKFRLLTEILATWADDQELSNVATALNEYRSTVMAAYKPGPPWGPRRSEEEASKVWRAAWDARERLRIRAFKVIDEHKSTRESRQQVDSLNADGAAPVVDETVGVKKRSGPKRKYSLRADRQVWNLWKSGNYKSFEVFLAECGSNLKQGYRTKADMIRLQQREKERKKRGA